MPTKQTHPENMDICQKKNPCGSNFWFWATIRIAIVVGLIV